MSRAILAVLPACVLAACAAAWGQTSYPMLMSLKPAAAQRGTTSEHVVSSRYNMHGAYRVLVEGTGVEGAVVPAESESSGGDKGEPAKTPNVQSLKLAFSVSADAMPGVREFRVATPQGVSTVGQLVICDEPVVVEAESNNRPEEAQPIGVPAAVCGALDKSEDVDVFKFTVDSATSLWFHVRSMRLQDKIHDLQTHADPIISLQSASGATLAMSDNVFAGDPLLHYHFEEPGDYLLEIRDVRYQGNQYWEYVIEISDRPFVTNVFPLGIRPGEPTAVTAIGSGLPGDQGTTVAIPSDTPDGRTSLRLPLESGPSNAVDVEVTSLPTVLESDGENNTPQTAQAVDISAGINGRLEQAADIDCYAFEARKGDKISVEVVARRRQSALDSVIRVLDANGSALKESDDMSLYRHSFYDSWIENWSVPADGKYSIEIRDLHLRGGADFVYFLKLTRAAPYFELYLDTAKTQLTPGTSSVVYVNAIHKNGFKEAIDLSIDGLPDGVTANCGRILPGSRDGCIILTTANDAPLSVANVSVRGTASCKIDAENTLALEAQAVPYQETYRPGGGRGHWPLSSHAVSVNAPADIRSVELGTYELTLRPGESQRIDVTVQRADGFDKNVTLDVLMQHLGGIFGNSLPPGVSVDKPNSKILLAGTESQGHIVLKAADNAAPVEKQLVPVLAHVSINFVMKATYSSRPLLVTVAPKQ